MARVFGWLRALVVFFTTGCALAFATGTQSPVPTPSPAGALSDVWLTLEPGLERRLYSPSAADITSPIVVVRIDPAYFTFRVHYRPGSPLMLGGWIEALPNVVAFVNGNFFDPQYRALGLLVADGVAHGQAYAGRGGMFQVQNGLPRVRSTVLEPYTGEALEQAVQAFPMLVTNGEPSYTNAADRDVSRRVAVGQDSQGRILFFTTLLFGLPLTDLSAFLAASDLDLVNVVNLDGGGSTMLYVGVGDPPYSLPSFDAVPSVLAVYRRE